jgi:G3E family GTPase
MDDGVSAYYLLDAVITVVDAKHGHDTLDQQPEAQNQVGFADRILMSKIDLVSEADAKSIEGSPSSYESTGPDQTGQFRRGCDR